MIPRTYAIGGFASFTALFSAIELANIAGLTGDAMFSAAIGAAGAGISLASMWRAS